MRWQAGLELEGLQAGDQAEKVVLERMQRRIRSFPGFAQIYRVAIMPQPWSVENGLLTPTMKLKRAKVVDDHGTEYDRPYAGH